MTRDMHSETSTMIFKSPHTLKVFAVQVLIYIILILSQKIKIHITADNVTIVDFCENLKGIISNVASTNMQ